jgi:hypothetical protein
MVGGASMEKVTITNKHGESITLGNAAPYYLEILDGVGEVSISIESQKSPYQDGSTYIDEFMSAYRVGVDGSWTSRLNCDIEKRVLFVERMGQMLNEIDEYSNFKYSRSIERCILKHQFDLLLAQARYKDVKNDKFAELYKKLDSSIKMKLFLRYYFPFLYAKIKNIKQTLTLTAKERQ